MGDPAMKTLGKVYITSISLIAAALASFPANAQDINKNRDLIELIAQVRTLHDLVKGLKASNDLLEAKLKCVSSLSGGNDFVFEGCNVHVRNGMGQTSTTNRYGNLIIGYNKNEVSTRSGSHNIVVGDLHEYTSYGGIVSGTENTLAGPSSTILSSSQSSARFSSGTILSADRGITDTVAVIAGGKQNYAGPTANFGVIAGGVENTIGGRWAVSVGGIFNTAAGSHSAVCGGSENQATGTSAVVCGGSGNISSALDSSISGGSRNSANGRGSSVSGGRSNSANGDYSSILGGNGRVVNVVDGTSP
jgi:hypothetical protein